jgi:hypothetical protein
MNCVVYRAVSSRKWVGFASLEVAHVWLYRGEWIGEFTLDEEVVSGITSLLTAVRQIIGKPSCLVSNSGKSFNGVKIYGQGFVLETEEASFLINENFRNKNVVFPYLNGEDLNSRSDQSPSRWVINFFDWALDDEHDDPKNPKGSPYAADYPDCLKIVEERVKPERVKQKENGAFTLRSPLPQKWWIYGDKRPALYQAISEMDEVIAIAATSRTLAFTFVPSNIVFSHATNIFAFDKRSNFAVLQSVFHEVWAREFSSSMKGDLRYTPSDVFETFPFPTHDPSDLSIQLPTLDVIGETYYIHRQAIMQTRQEGLTKTYNRFHDANEIANDLQKLRELHIEMDRAVAAAYGWQDLDLGHGFHKTKQGDRFTISETARREVLDRLLELNHQRYAEEVALGLHDKGKKKGKGKTTKVKKATVKPDSEAEQITLF